MVRSPLALLRSLFSRSGVRPKRASILLPFLIISIGLGVLAWRSYHLSVRTERNADTLAAQSAGYAAEITARRVDAAIRQELARAAEEWQLSERRSDPDFAMTREWMSHYPWLLSALYIPDFDPASSTFVRDPNVSEVQKKRQQKGEFFTSTGSVRYEYDPDSLLRSVSQALQQQPLVHLASSMRQPTEVHVVRGVSGARMLRLPRAFAFVAPLAAPLESYGIRAVVKTSYAGSGWENQRIISLILSLVAVLLTAGGTMLAFRGLRKEAETTELRAALIANVSHELRTPLSMIRLAAETLKRGKLKEHERQVMEDQILREALLLSHLVENVLDVARIQARSAKALAFAPVQPRELVRNLLATYEGWISSKGFEVELDVDEEVGEQMWDRDAVSRALLNLIDNAIKYSAEEKVIAVELKQDDEYVILEVRDHGIGLSSVDQAHIFEPYFRAQFSDTITRRGAGLGLTLVQQIAASHGGKVEVESEEGHGSTFRLLFPRQPNRDDSLAMIETRSAPARNYSV